MKPPAPTRIRIGRPTIRLTHADGTETVIVCPAPPPISKGRARAALGVAGLLVVAFVTLAWESAAAPLLLAMPSVIPIAFKKALFSGRAWKAALYIGAANLGNATAGYSGANEVVGAGYVAGGKSLVETVLDGSDGVTALLDFANVSWPAASFVARYILVYDNNAAGKEGFVIDMGQDQQISGGTFTIEWPAPDLLTAIMAAA